MRRSLSALAIAAGVAACVHRPGALTQQPDQRSGVRSDEQLHARLSPPSASGLHFSLNRPAYVAIFEIVPGAGVSLVYPSRRSEVVVHRAGVSARHLPSSISGRWFYASSDRREPRFLFMIASEQRLWLDEILAHPAELRSSLGLMRYASHDAYRVMEELIRQVVPPQPDDAWSTDIYIDWPNVRRGGGYSSYSLNHCLNGHSFLVPDDWGFYGCPGDYCPSGYRSYSNRYGYRSCPGYYRGSGGTIVVTRPPPPHPPGGTPPGDSTVNPKPTRADSIIGNLFPGWKPKRGGGGGRTEGGRTDAELNGGEGLAHPVYPPAEERPEPVHLEPRRMEPPRHEPPRHEPNRYEPNGHEPRRHEPPRRYEPPRVQQPAERPRMEPPRHEPRHEPVRTEPVHREPPRHEPRHEPVRTEPVHREPPRHEPRVERAEPRRESPRPEPPRVEHRTEPVRMESPRPVERPIESQPERPPV